MGCCDAPGLMPIEEAMPIILKNTPIVTETETLAIEDAIGRVLAHDVSSPLNVPPFDNSAMDGYAVRIADLKRSLNMPLVGKSFAGAPFNDEWPQDSCVRIMTGAKILRVVTL